MGAPLPGRPPYTWVNKMRSQFSTRAALSAAALVILAACTAGDLAAPAANEADSAVVTIAAARGSYNQAPSVWLFTPTAGASYAAGTSISFTGHASDRESGAPSGSSVVWSSDRDGQFGTGESFSYAGLSAGTHIISLTATDPQGKSTKQSR